MQLIRKTFTAQLKVLNEDQGIVEAVVNSMGVVDHDNEILGLAAFDDAINKSKKGEDLPAVCWFHDQSQIVGGVTSLRKDGSKLVAQMQFDLDTEPGAYAFKMVKRGRIREYSVGFYVLDEDMVRVEGSKGLHRQITKTDLVEISCVMRGASPDTGTNSVKGRKGPIPAGALPLDTPEQIASAITLYNSGFTKDRYPRAADWRNLGVDIVSDANKTLGEGHDLKGASIVAPERELLGKFYAPAPEGSYEDLLDDLRKIVTVALIGIHDPYDYDCWPWVSIACTFPDYCIAVLNIGDEAEYFRIPYTIGADQEPQIGDPEPVDLTFTPSAQPDADLGTLSAAAATSQDAAATETKRGARNSAADLEHLQGMHDLAHEVHAHALAMGATCDEGDDIDQPDSPEGPQTGALGLDTSSLMTRFLALRTEQLRRHSHRWI